MIARDPDTRRERDGITGATLARELLDILDLEQVDTDVFRGHRMAHGVGRVFGGEVVAQALRAAERSIDDARPVHAIHANFLRPGKEGVPITYRVAREFDGRSFAARRVEAVQDDRTILLMTASFQTREDGMRHQDAMPRVPPPEEVLPIATLRHELTPTSAKPPLRPVSRPIELRPTQPDVWCGRVPQMPVLRNWMRLSAPIGEDDALHRAVLAYASDMMLLVTALLPHGVHPASHPMQIASLDHALWFHEDVRADTWLLYDCDSPWAGHGRGLNRGRFFTRDGRLVASVAQEGLIRLRD